MTQEHLLRDVIMYILVLVSNKGNLVLVLETLKQHENKKKKNSNASSLLFTQLKSHNSIDQFNINKKKKMIYWSCSVIRIF